MKKKGLKRILLGVLSLFLFLVLVLGVHIYIVTRPKPPGPTTRIMARIDIKEPITGDDVVKITNWMYQQKGIDRIMVNPKSDIVVFTYYPVKTNGNKITDDFKAAFGYNAVRYVPTTAELEGGCPVASSSISYKAYKFIKNIF